MIFTVEVLKENDNFTNVLFEDHVLISTNTVSAL